MIRILTLVFALTLGACATVPTPPTRSPEELSQRWQQHSQAVTQLTDWSLSGRIVVKTAEDGWNGELHWSQTSNDYQIRFSAPLGQGAFQLDGRINGVEMRFSDGKSFQSADAESLLLQHLGWRLPLGGFRYWVTGLPQPQTDSVLNYNRDGLLAGLDQDQWKVSYPDYSPVGDMMMPRKVYFKNHELSVRLVIDQWTLGAGT